VQQRKKRKAKSGVVEKSCRTDSVREREREREREKRE